MPYSGELLILPKQLIGVPHCSPITVVPISFKPNAGMPQFINRKTIFPGTPEEFTEVCLKAYDYGINMLGGCCGTDPQYIKMLSEKLKNKPPVTRKQITHHLLLINIYFFHF